jgi:hypothetical protein
MASERKPVTIDSEASGMIVNKIGCRFGSGVCLNILNAAKPQPKLSLDEFSSDRAYSPPREEGWLRQ